MSQFDRHAADDVASLSTLLHLCELSICWAKLFPVGIEQQANRNSCDNRDDEELAAHLKYVQRFGVINRAKSQPVGKWGVVSQRNGFIGQLNFNLVTA